MTPSRTFETFFKNIKQYRFKYRMFANSGEASGVMGGRAATSRKQSESKKRQDLTRFSPFETILS